MKIANGVEMLEIQSNVMGMVNIINPTLIWDDNLAILVDAGYPGQLPQILEAVEKIGIEFDKIKMVMITHHDIDHIGSVSSILKALPEGVEVLAHEEEKAYIEGTKQPVKVAQLEANLEKLSDEMKITYEKLKVGFTNCKVNVDKTFIDGDELTCCGGVRVVFTPGHTSGHICLYLKQSKTLIAGDMLMVNNGELVQTPSYINFNNELSIKSLKKLTEYDIERVICYHGGIYTNKVNERIAELARE